MRNLITLSISLSLILMIRGDNVDCPISETYAGGIRETALTFRTKLAFDPINSETIVRKYKFEADLKSYNISIELFDKTKKRIETLREQGLINRDKKLVASSGQCVIGNRISKYFKSETGYQMTHFFEDYTIKIFHLGSEYLENLDYLDENLEPFLTPIIFMRTKAFLFKAKATNFDKVNHYEYEERGNGYHILYSAKDVDRPVMIEEYKTKNEEIVGVLKCPTNTKDQDINFKIIPYNIPKQAKELKGSTSTEIPSYTESEILNLFTEKPIVALLSEMLSVTDVNIEPTENSVYGRFITEDDDFSSTTVMQETTIYNVDTTTEEDTDTFSTTIKILDETTTMIQSTTENIPIPFEVTTISLPNVDSNIKETTTIDEDQEQTTTDSTDEIPSTTIIEVQTEDNKEHQNWDTTTTPDSGEDGISTEKVALATETYQVDLDEIVEQSTPTDGIEDITADSETTTVAITT